MNNVKRSLIAMLLLLISTSAIGQYTGPGSTDRFYTVQEILDSASILDKTDAVVKIRGYIIERINKDTYLFKDNTGTIRVEMGKKIIPASPFDDKTELILIGEVDNDLFEYIELEVDQIIFAGQ